jgi:hypothetical protein
MTSVCIGADTLRYDGKTDELLRPLKREDELDNAKVLEIVSFSTQHELWKASAHYLFVTNLFVIVISVGWPMFILFHLLARSVNLLKKSIDAIIDLHVTDD